MQGKNALRTLLIMTLIESDSISVKSKGQIEMIKVTRLNDSVLIINVEMIQSLQATPDTVITFTNRDKLMVKEPIEEISQKIVEYQRAINSNYLHAVTDASTLAHPEVSI